MIVADVNVLLAAHRDDHPHHPLVRPWFDRLLRALLGQPHHLSLGPGESHLALFERRVSSEPTRPRRSESTR